MRRAWLLLLAALLFLPASIGAEAVDAGLLQARQLYAQRKFSEAAAILVKLDQGGRLKPADLVLLGLCDIELARLDEARAALSDP
jgi:hypothetical protein